MDLERKSPFDLAIVLQPCLPFVTKLENNWVPLENNQEYLSVRNHEDHYEPLLGSVPEKGTLSGRDWNLEKLRLELLVGMIWFYHTEFSHGDHSKKKLNQKMVDERNRDLLNEFYFVLVKVLTNLPLDGEIIFLRFVFCTGKFWSS